MTKELTATSESHGTDDSEYPKRFTIVVSRDVNNADKVLVKRTCENMSGFELYGLLQVVLRAVEIQVSFPETQRSDGIVITGVER